MFMDNILLSLARKVIHCILFGNSLIACNYLGTALFQTVVFMAVLQINLLKEKKVKPNRCRNFHRPLYFYVAIS